MQRFLIDITRVAYRRFRDRHPTGIDRVGLAYVSGYGDRARAVLSLGPFSAVLSARDSRLAFGLLASGRALPKSIVFRVLAKAFLWQWFAFDVRGALLLNVVHTGLESPHYAFLLRLRGARMLAFVHDLIPLSHPEYFRPGELGRHGVRMELTAKIAHAVVANSTHTLGEFERFVRSRGLRMPPATVARLGPGLPTAPPGPRPLAQPYFVVLGTIEPRKNHAMLLHLWRRLAERHGERAPRLAVIGHRGWECEHVADLLERCLPLRGVVVELPDCDDAQAVTWLAHAQAVLYPSFVEGYGLPLLEALVHGVPAIASDLEVFREVAGDVPEYVDPLDAPRWEALVLEYAREASAARQAQLARLRAHAPMTWEAHFREVDAFLASLAPGAAPPDSRY